MNKKIVNLIGSVMLTIVVIACVALLYYAADPHTCRQGSGFKACIASHTANTSFSEAITFMESEGFTCATRETGFDTRSLSCSRNELVVDFVTVAGVHVYGVQGVP
jgi:hypothetical protein